MIRYTARLSLWRMLALVFAALMILQMFVSPLTFETISIGALFVVFAFKSIVNTISAYTMWRQQGTSSLAKACMRYFWSQDSMSVLLAFLFLLAFTDRISWALPGTDLTIVRNILRSFVITSVVAVGILGSQMMSALFDFLREQIAENQTRRQTPDGLN